MSAICSDMALFALGDLHLSIGASDKPMDVFRGWENYVALLQENWQNTVSIEDTVVIAGDVSWAMRLEDALDDFAFINQLNGKKIILKGNHDYWWTSMRKMMNFFESNDFDTLNILHNNYYEYDGYAICGTRGWVSVDGETEDAKVLRREVMRLEASVKPAFEKGLVPLTFLHYPPVYAGSCNYDILDILYKYQVTRCYYGHIHGYACKNAVNGISDGIDFALVSADYLKFTPFRVL